MANQNNPIGIIDSGIGGFSVARRVQKQLPHENIVYFGDGANTPYGNHNAKDAAYTLTPEELDQEAAVRLVEKG